MRNTRLQNRISKITQEELEHLQAVWGCSQNEAVTRAISQAFSSLSDDEGKEEELNEGASDE